VKNYETAAYICNVDISSVGTSVTSALEVNFSNMRYINLHFTLLNFTMVYEKLRPVELESCPISGQMFDFLALPNFWRASPQKILHK